MHTHMNMYTHTHTGPHTCTYAHTQIHTYVLAHTGPHMCTSTQMYTPATYMYAHTHMYTHQPHTWYIHTYTDPCTFYTEFLSFHQGCCLLFFADESLKFIFA